MPKGDGGRYELHILRVFTIAPGGISHNVVFQDAEVIAAFGLPVMFDPSNAS